MRRSGTVWNLEPTTRADGLTSSEWHIGELLPVSRAVSEVALGGKVHPVLPGVVEPVVDGGGDAHLVAHGDGVACCFLRGGGWRQRVVTKPY